MIGPDRLQRISADAVVPEQIVCYVRAVAGSTPRLFDSCVGYELDDNLVLIGYPLHDPLDEQALTRSVDIALADGAARHIAVLAATRPKQAPLQALQHVHVTQDAYLSLPVPAGAVRQKLRNLLRRAEREVILDQGRDLGQDHIALIDAYLESRDLEPGTRQIFCRIPAYIQACPGAWIVSARLEDGRLAGLAVGDFTSLSTVIYMFAFRNQGIAPPGTADLLLHALLQEGARRGQVRMNLGLGINPAIRFFKQKWGATTFLPYVETRWEHRPVGWLEKMRRWSMRR